MSFFKGDEKVRQEIETVATAGAEEVEVVSAQEAYENAFKLRKRVTVSLLSLVIISELAVVGLFSYENFQNDFHRRVYREFEVRSTGQIKLATGTYTGETDFGYFFGDGKFDFLSGTSYVGNWKENNISGEGILRIPIEGIYEGGFKASQKSGKGVFTWDDGSVYDGEWKEDRMTGQGVYTDASGVIYSGTFKENAFYTGTCSFTNETGEYAITYKDGVIDDAEILFLDGSTYKGGADEISIKGTGELSFSNGDNYYGAFENGQRNGNGKYTWASGDTYDGGWSNDQMAGTGTYTLSNGSTLQGTFLDNSFTDGSYHVVNDFGDYTFNISEQKPVSVKIVLSDGTTYEGDMDENGLNGHAQIKYSNGDKYDGKVLNGTKSGQGTYKWKSGASYDGGWNDDRMSGRGTYMYPSSEDGYKLVGEFANGLPEGECEYYTDTYTHYKTDWRGGVCVKISE